MQESLKFTDRKMGALIVVVPCICGGLPTVLVNHSRVGLPMLSKPLAKYLSRTGVQFRRSGFGLFDRAIHRPRAQTAILTRISTRTRLSEIRCKNEGLCKRTSC